MQGKNTVKFSKDVFLFHQKYQKILRKFVLISSERSVVTGEEVRAFPEEAAAVVCNSYLT